MQTYVIAMTPTSAFAPTDLGFNFGGENTARVEKLGGLNTLLLSASTTPVPDVVALGATIGNTGIVNIPGNTGTGVFGVATVNVGVAGPITVSAETSGANLPVNIALCETDPATALVLAQLWAPEYPIPVGVLARKEETTYEEILVHQEQQAISERGPGDIAKLLVSGETWKIG